MVNENIKGLADFANDAMEEYYRKFLKEKPKVGQRIFVVQRQRNSQPLTRESVVEKVGKKYFTVKSEARKRFYISNKAEADTYDSYITLYPSEDCYQYCLDKLKVAYEIQSLINRVGGQRSLSNLPMSKLSMVLNIVSEVKHGKD